MTDSLEALAQKLVKTCQSKGLHLTLAESCTGGLIAASITGIAGASSVLEFGWVCYSAAAKIQQLGVTPELIGKHGVVSEPVAMAMAQGAYERAHSHIALSVTGNAGPTAEPGAALVGTVCLAFITPTGGAESMTWHLPNLPRNEWRMRVAQKAIAHLLSRLENHHA